MLLTRKGDATWGAETDVSGVVCEYVGAVSKATLRLTTHPAGSVKVDQLYAQREREGYKAYLEVSVVNNRIKGVHRSFDQDSVSWATITEVTTFSTARESIHCLWQRIAPVLEPAGVRFHSDGAQSLIISPTDEIGVTVQSLSGRINANGFGSGTLFPHSSPAAIAAALWWSREGLVSLSVDGNVVRRPDQLPSALFMALQSVPDLLKVMGMESVATQVKPLNYAALLRR